MGTKEFNSIIQNIPHKEVTSGEHESVEIVSGNHIIEFSLDCDIEIKYYSGSTYLNPEEYDLVTTKNISNIKVISDDYETFLKLNNLQMKRLKKEINLNLEIVY